MEYKLEDYQEEAILNTSKSLLNNNSVILSLPTGAGKTIIAANIIKRFLDKSDKEVVVFTHRKELFVSMLNTVEKWFNLRCKRLDVSSGSLLSQNLFGETSRITLVMVKTFSSRLSSDLKLHFKNTGLVIIDECHIGDFKFIFPHFLLPIKIGLTATPRAATKKDPLLNYYTDIIVGATVKQLISHNERNPLRGVLPVITYTVKQEGLRDEVEKRHTDLGKKTGLFQDYDDKIVGDVMSGKRQIQNTIDAYLKHAYGKKMLCFDANVEHSQLVCKEMVLAGLKARHLNGSHSDKVRDDSFKWLRETEGAILCNVGIATTGFDDPSVEGVIFNKMTKSENLFLQMGGRSARPYKYPDGTLKKHHIHIDMGDNVIAGKHGEWSDDRDWKTAFFEPNKPREGVAPCKSCPECGSLLPASARVCNGMVQDLFNEDETHECGYEFPIKEDGEDLEKKELVIITKNINVDFIVESFADKKEMFAFYEICRQVVYWYSKDKELCEISESEFNNIYTQCYVEIRKWLTLRNKRNSGFLSSEAKKTLCENLQKAGYTLNFEKKEEYLNKKYYNQGLTLTEEHLNQLK